MSIRFTAGVWGMTLAIAASAAATPGLAQAPAGHYQPYFAIRTIEMKDKYGKTLSSFYSLEERDSSGRRLTSRLDSPVYGGKLTRATITDPVKTQMIEIDYEDLVTNKEIVLREVLEFCGLEWDDACLNHEQNVSQVSTPSLWTARQPVNTASVERWRKYEPWLGKLLELKDVKHPEPVRASHITQL